MERKGQIALSLLLGLPRSEKPQFFPGI